MTLINNDRLFSGMVEINHTLVTSVQRSCPTSNCVILDLEIIMGTNAVSKGHEIASRDVFPRNFRILQYVYTCDLC